MRNRYRALAIVGVLGVAVVVARVAAPSAIRPVHYTSMTCGVERWGLKTLQDRPRLLAAKATTVGYLVSRPAPSSPPATRLPFERHIFRVTARVTLVRPEDDGDYHLVLVDSGGRTMIGEAPVAGCSSRATATRIRQMAQARRAVKLCAKASVTGVAFFDFKHGQTGVAPNAIELHPILAFKCLSGSSPPPPTTTSPTTTGPRPSKCAASYPDECIPPPPPDLNCADIPYRNFRVLWNVPDPDPHHFDGNHDGVGCEK